MLFYGSRLVFHGSGWVFRVFQGSRFLRIFHVSRLIFIVPGRFSLVLGGFFMVFKVPGWFLMITGGILW